jgi:hypothetical protein
MTRQIIINNGMSQQIYTNTEQIQRDVTVFFVFFDGTHNFGAVPRVCIHRGGICIGKK